MYILVDLHNIYFKWIWVYCFCWKCMSKLPFHPHCGWPWDLSAVWNAAGYSGSARSRSGSKKHQGRYRTVQETNVVNAPLWRGRPTRTTPYHMLLWILQEFLLKSLQPGVYVELCTWRCLLRGLIKVSKRRVKSKNRYFASSMRESGAKKKKIYKMNQNSTKEERGGC